MITLKLQRGDTVIEPDDFESNEDTTSIWRDSRVNDRIENVDPVELIQWIFTQLEPHCRDVELVFDADAYDQKNRYDQLIDTFLQRIDVVREAHKKVASFTYPHIMDSDRTKQLEYYEALNRHLEKSSWDAIKAYFAIIDSEFECVFIQPSESVEKPQNKVVEEPVKRLTITHLGSNVALHGTALAAGSSSQFKVSFGDEEYTYYLGECGRKVITFKTGEILKHVCYAIRSWGMTGFGTASCYIEWNGKVYQDNIQRNCTFYLPDMAAREVKNLSGLMDIYG